MSKSPLSPSVHWGRVEVLTEPRRTRRKTVKTTVLKSGLKKSWGSIEALNSKLSSLDYFEKNPKTDYTYSRSGSYSPTQVNNGYVSPNLSRLGLVYSHTAVHSQSNSVVQKLTFSSATEDSTSAYSSGYSSATASASESVAAQSSAHRLSSNHVSNRSSSSTVVTETSEEETTVMAGRRGGARTPARNTRMTRANMVSGSPASGDRVTRSRRKTPPRVYETYEHEEVSQRTITPSPGRRGDSSGSSRRMKDKTIKHLYGLDDGSDLEEMTIESTSETSTFLGQSSSNQSLYKNVILSPFKYLYKLIVWVLALDTWLVSKSKLSRSSKSNSVLFFIALLLLPLILGLMCHNVYPADVVHHLLSPVFGFGSFLSSIGASLASVFSRTETKYATEDRMMFTSPIDKMDEKVKRLILNIGQNKDKLTAAEVEVIVRKLMQEEMAQFLSRIDSETGRHMARQVQINSDFETRLSSQHTLLASINDRAQQLALDLSTAKENIKIEQLDQRNGTALRLSDLDTELAALRRELLKVQTIQSDMMINLKSCCKNESYIVGLMKRLMHDEWYSATGGVGGKADDFNFWLQQQFVNKQAFEEKFRELADRLAREIRATERGESTQVIINTPNGTGLSEDHVRNLIQESLNVYSADKTGMVDYALETAGGSIVSTRCSETYGKTAQLTLFGFPLWFVHQSPRTVIQPDVQPGQCWAFKGTQGYIVIQLSAAVHPTSFSMEHIPKQLSPTGNIDSAPKEFSVWGLQNEKQTRGVHLGDYTYDKNGSPLQFFPVKNTNAGLFPIVELKIHSNHGNSDYTCIYRFRVHGVLQET